MAKMKDIATVQMGVSLRSRLEPEKDGDLTVIQMGDIRGEYGLPFAHKLTHIHQLAVIHKQGFKEHHFVQQKDLIFRSRGTLTTAAIINDDEIDRAIVLAPLLRIRVTDDRIMPEYLCWFINQPPAQSFLRSKSTGATMVMVGKSILDTLDIPIPNLANQKKIIELVILAHREREIMEGMSTMKKIKLNRDLMAMTTEPSIGLY